MLDLKFIREHFDDVRKGAEAKGLTVNLGEILSLDERRRALIQEGESLKATRNQVSAEIGKLKKEGKAADKAIGEMETVKARIQVIDGELRELEQSLGAALLTVPNIPHPSVPLGKTPAENKEIFTWGEAPVTDSPLKPHWEIAERLGILDFNRGSKVSGAGFPFFVGKGARLERAVINFFLDQAGSGGYTEMAPPIVINEQSARGTGQIPDKEDLMYALERDHLFLIPTAEVPVTNIHRDEILKESDLPIYYTAYTPCFRREAGSYGKDTRGLIRQHQFNKVEMVKFVKPEDSYSELERLTHNAEEILQKLSLPYRVVALCTGDLGFSAAKTYDLEVWLPGQGKYREISSCSNFGDFQARRANIRFKREGRKGTEFVHTLNGSGLAIGRTVVAILENYQQKDGSVVIPEALRSYMGTDRIG